MQWIKSNLTGLLSFVIVIATAIQGLNDFSLVNDLQIAALVVSTFVVIIVPLVKVAWAGALKTGLDLGFAVITILIPFVALWVAGAPLTHGDLTLIVIAFTKAVATEFGVQIRTDWGATTPKAVIDAGTFTPGQAAVITSAEEPGITPALVSTENPSTAVGSSK